MVNTNWLILLKQINRLITPTKRAILKYRIEIDNDLITELGLGVSL